MTDQFDRAQKLEAQFRDQALARHRHVQDEAPDLDNEGNRYCLDCGVLIDVERLRVLPSAVRCVKCQSAKEY